MKRGLGISSRQGYTRELIRIVLELAPVVVLQEGAERERNLYRVLLCLRLRMGPCLALDVMEQAAAVDQHALFRAVLTIPFKVLVMLYVKQMEDGVVHLVNA